MHEVVSLLVSLSKSFLFFAFLTLGHRSAGVDLKVLVGYCHFGLYLPNQLKHSWFSDYGNMQEMHESGMV